MRTSQENSERKTYRIPPPGAALERESREERRRLRAVDWRARPFWQLCRLAAWIPISVAFAYGLQQTWEPYVWSWSPLRLNIAEIGRALVLGSAFLSTFLQYRIVVDA